MDCCIQRQEKFSFLGMLSFMKISSFSKNLIPTATLCNLNHLSFTQNLSISNDLAISSTKDANHMIMQMLIKHIHIYPISRIPRFIQNPPTSIQTPVMIYDNLLLILWNQIILLSHIYPICLANFEGFLLTYKALYVSKSLQLFHLRTWTSKMK